MFYYQPQKECLSKWFLQTPSRSPGHLHQLLPVLVWHTTSMHPRPHTKLWEEVWLTQIVKWSSLDFTPLLSTTSLSKLATQGAWVNQLEGEQLPSQQVSIIQSYIATNNEFVLNLLTTLSIHQLIFAQPTAPSAPPESAVVREKGAHWAMVGWGIPPEAWRNGIIISYLVQLVDTHGAVVRNETIVVNNPTFDSPQSAAHNLTSLKPYTIYIWRVAATTTAGTGPFTSAGASAQFRTLQWSEL